MLSALLWYWIALQLAYWIFIFIGLRRFDRAPPVGPEQAAPAPFDLLIPAYNETSHLPLIARMLDNARATGIAAIVIDDGSCDGSTEALERLCKRGGARLLRHPANRGKAAALRSGLGAVEASYLMTLDADTIMVLAAASRTNVAPKIGAVAFTVIAAETGCFLSAAQAAEYTYVLNFERAALAGFGIVLTVPGAASLWRTESLRDIGGFSSRTSAEDTDATIALQMAGWRIAVAPHVVAVTDCPSTLRSLIQQRARWIWGNLHAACYAAGDCRGDRVACRRPAYTMIAVSVMVLAGYAIATATLIRFLVFDIVVSDVVASAVLCAATMLRIIVARRLRAMPARGLLATLLALLAMQAINFAGFWYGALTGRRQWSYGQ